MDDRLFFLPSTETSTANDSNARVLSLAAQAIIAAQQMRLQSFPTTKKTAECMIHIMELVDRAFPSTQDGYREVIETARALGLEVNPDLVKDLVKAHAAKGGVH